jgi:hypothetical protein
MENAIQVLMSPLPGQRLIEGQEAEDGSILAYRKCGDEGLFASWFLDEDENKPGKPMVWIKISEFSPDPEAIRPPEIMEGNPEENPPQDAGDGTQERPIVEGPFGRPRGRSKRPQA